jgi:hypothetical protein
MRSIFVIFLALASLSHSTLSAQSLAQNRISATNSHSVDVQKAVAAFIEAFNSLDWERFRRSFSDDATVFSPSKPCRVVLMGELRLRLLSSLSSMRYESENPIHHI